MSTITLDVHDVHDVRNTVEHSEHGRGVSPRTMFMFVGGVRGGLNTNIVQRAAKAPALPNPEPAANAPAKRFVAPALVAVVVARTAAPCSMDASRDGAVATARFHAENERTPIGSSVGAVKVNVDGVSTVNGLQIAGLEAPCRRVIRISNPYSRSTFTERNALSRSASLSFAAATRVNVAFRLVASCCAHSSPPIATAAPSSTLDRSAHALIPGFTASVGAAGRRNSDGKQAVQLAAVAPAKKPPGKAGEDKGNDCPLLPATRTEKNLRAIVRAPEASMCPRGISLAVSAVAASFRLNTNLPVLNAKTRLRASSCERGPALGRSAPTTDIAPACPFRRRSRGHCIRPELPYRSPAMAGKGRANGLSCLTNQSLTNRPLGAKDRK